MHIVRGDIIAVVIGIGTETRLYYKIKADPIMSIRAIQVASFLRSYFGPIIKLENSPRLWSSKSKMSVPTHGCCRAILYFTNPNKILPSKKERDNDWGLDDHDLRAIL